VTPPNPDRIPIDQLFDLTVSEIEGSLHRGNAHTYKPYADQIPYHASRCTGRYISGGNRAGKTDSQVMDAYWTATNTHPYRPRPANWGPGPVQLRFVVVDIAKGVEQILLPKLKRWIPRSACINNDFFQSWDSKNLTFTFANGSSFDVLTYGMTIDKHGGVPRHGIYFDEEPPREIFNESMMRLRDYRGFWSIAATPVNGITWTFDLLWEPAEDGRIDFISTHIFDPDNNPYLDSDEDAVKEYTVGMDREEVDIRLHGKFVAKSGLVFPMFNKATHVLAAPLPLYEYRNWKWYSSVDVGWSNPTAWLWHAVSPDGRIYTFAEHYKSHMTIGEHSKVVLDREREWGKTPDLRTGDPAMKQTSMITGTNYLMEYGKYGIGIGVEGVPHDVMIGVEKMQQYLNIEQVSPWGAGRPTWMVSPNCVNLIRELKKLRWASYDSSKMAYDKNKKEEIHKKDDHAADSLRYFFTLMMDLVPVPPDRQVGDGAPLGSYWDVMKQIQDGRERELASTATTMWDTLDPDMEEVEQWSAAGTL
jgi:phage terminase large subunit-like protein